MPSGRSTRLVDAAISLMTGLHTLFSAHMTPTTLSATPSGFFIAMRLGASSPKISMK